MSKINIKIAKKKNYEMAAEIKTISDYALVLEHLNGYDRTESQKLASESQAEPLFKALLKRNTELFVTGDIVMFGQ
jgi:hypothetical protein